MKKESFIILISFTSMLHTHCMEGPLNNAQEKEVHIDTSNAEQEIRNEQSAAKDEKFQWENVRPKSGEIRNFMWKPDYSTQSTTVNNDPKAGKKFWQRRFRDTDDLISHIIIKSGYTIFERLGLGKALDYIDFHFLSSEFERSIHILNQNIKKNNYYAEQKSLIFNRMKNKESELKSAKSIRKKAFLIGKFRRLNQARKITCHEEQEWEDKFTDSILRHKKLKEAQPKTTLTIKDGKFETTSEDVSQFLAMIEEEQAENDDILQTEEEQETVQEVTKEEQAGTPENGYILQQLKTVLPKVALFFALG